MAQRTVFVGVGNTITIVAGKEATGGAYALLDYELAPGFASLPPHTHQREDEVLYVLEGRLLVRCGAGERLLGPGEFIQLPRGVVHAQRNPGQEPVRFLALLLPAGFEQCLEDLDTLLGECLAFSADTIAPLLARHGVRPAVGTET